MRRMFIMSFYLFMFKFSNIEVLHITFLGTFWYMCGRFKFESNATQSNQHYILHLYVCMYSPVSIANVLSAQH